MKEKYEDAGLASDENIAMIEKRAGELDSYDGPFSDELAFGGGKKKKRNAGSKVAIKQSKPAPVKTKKVAPSKVKAKKSIKKTASNKK